MVIAVLRFAKRCLCFYPQVRIEKLRSSRRMTAIIERVKTNFRKNKIIILVSFLLWAIILGITLYGYRNSLGKESVGNLEYNYVEVLNKDRSLSQIVDSVDGVNSVSVRFEVYKKNNSNVTIEIVGQDSKKVYATKTMKAKNIMGAAYNTVGLNEDLNSSIDKKIIINIQTDDDSGAIGAWCSFNNVFNNNTLQVGNEKKDGSLSLRLLFDSEMFRILTNSIVITSAVFVTIVIILALLFEPKKETIYTLMVLVFGLIFMVVVVPLSGPDEEYHYRTSLLVSNKIMNKTDPEMIEDEYIGYYDTFECNFNIGAVYRTVIEHFNDEMEDLANQPKYNLERGYVYHYDLCYFPQAIFITLARLMNFNLLKTYYMGRIGSFLFYIICVYIALKKAPVLKDLIGIVALVPINIQQAVCYSTDMWISVLSLVIFACFLQWTYQDRKVSKADFIFLLIVELMLAPAKMIYSLFMLLFWFVPKDKFCSNKHRIIVLLILMLPMAHQVGRQIFYRIWYTILSLHKVHAEDTGTGTVHEINQVFFLFYILGHPLEAVAITFRTIRHELKSWFAGAIGRYLSGLTLIIPSQLSHCIVAILVASALVFEKISISIKAKLTGLGICVLIGMLTLAVMLTGWTDIKDEYIQGIQGRYFTPLLPYVFFVFNNKKIFIPQKYSNIIICAESLLMFEIIVYMLSATLIY